MLFRSYIAAAADRIYVSQGSVVGSIGVLMSSFGFSGLMNKLGIERRLMTAGENKAMMDPFQPQNPRHRAYTQSMLDEIHQQFIAAVRSGRGKRLKNSPEIFSGLFRRAQRSRPTISGVSAPCARSAFQFRFQKNSPELRGVHAEAILGSPDILRSIAPATRVEIFTEKLAEILHRQIARVAELVRDDRCDRLQFRG